MKSNNQPLEEETSSEKMTTLSSATNHSVEKGYTINFNVQSNGMLWDGADKYYDPEEVTVQNFYRFEGESDPADSSILYLLCTNDGRKGTLIDAYGAYDDLNVSEFIRRVTEIQKKKHSMKTIPWSNTKKFAVAAGAAIVGWLLYKSIKGGLKT